MLEAITVADFELFSAKAHSSILMINVNNFQ